MSNQPWDFGQALTASRNAETEQRRVESDVSEAYKTYARADRLHAVARARRMMELKAQGVAITACKVLADGDPEIAALCEAREVAEGMKEVAKVAAWRVNADRRDIGDLLRWSARRDLAEGYGTTPAPVYESPIGGRA